MDRMLDYEEIPFGDPPVDNKVRLDHLPCPHTSPGCRRCGCEVGTLGRYIQVNGRIAARWVCDRCGDYGSTGDIAGRVTASFGYTVAELPVCVDRSGEYVERDACWCGSPGMEDHHWAPKALFPDWPWHLTIPLCVDHHREWHDRMRQHGLRWPYEH